MTSREKILAAIIGAVIFVGLAYKGVSVFYIQAKVDAMESIKKNEKELARVQKLVDSVDSKNGLADRWMEYSRKTFSFDRNDAQSSFSKAIKEICKKHGFEDAVFSNSNDTKIGTNVKNKITAVVQRVGVMGKYEQVTELLRDLYKTPFLCAITKLNIQPLGAKGGRDVVKAEFTIESPLLPTIDLKKIPAVKNVQTMAATIEDWPTDPARKSVREDSFYDIFKERNIFRSYLAPPENVVIVNNKDRKIVALKLTSYWENKVATELVETVNGKASLPLKVKGNEVEIRGTYVDGATFGPKKMKLGESGKGKEQGGSYVIESHSPPTVVELAVDNQSGEEVVYAEMTLTTEDNQQKTQPTVAFFTPGETNFGTIEAKTVKIAIKYKSGKAGVNKTFTPKEGKQTLTIPAEPKEPVKPEVEETPVATPSVPDDPPDTTRTVSGLAYYPDPDGKNEMIFQMTATKPTGERTIIRVGEEGAVDGGTLVTIVPGIGGIVKMAKTGNYYLYPLGRTFGGRTKLEAESEEDFAAAIDLWSRR